MNPALLGLMAALAWGVHDFAARFPSREIGAAHATFGVTLAGLLWLSLWLAATGAPPELQLQHLWLPALTGISFVFATLWLFAAISAGPIAVVAPLIGAFPIYAVAFAAIMGARPTALEWIAMAAVVLGVAVVARHGEAAQEGGGSLGGRASVPTLIYAGLAGLGFAGALTAGQYATPIYGEVETIWLARIFGLIAVTIACLARRSSSAIRLGRYGRWWILLVVMGLLDSLALVAVVIAGHQPQAEIATVASSSFGAITVILARIFLKETVTAAQWAGIAVIFAGVAVLSA